MEENFFINVVLPKCTVFLKPTVVQSPPGLHTHSPHSLSATSSPVSPVPGECPVQVCCCLALTLHFYCAFSVFGHVSRHTYHRVTAACSPQYSNMLCRLVASVCSGLDHPAVWKCLCDAHTTVTILRTVPSGERCMTVVIFSYSRFFLKTTVQCSICIIWYGKVILYLLMWNFHS